MRKSMFLSLALCLAAASAMAQGGGDGRGMGPERILGGTVEDLTKQLSLTEEQVPKVQAIFDETQDLMTEAMAAMQEQGGGFQGMREVFERMREQQREDLKAVLTDDQKAAYDQLLVEEEARRGQRGGGFGGGRGRRNETPEQRAERLGRAIEGLGLEAEQVELVRPLVEKYAELSDARRKAWTDGQAELAKLLAADGSSDEAIDAQLATMGDAVKAIEKDMKEARGLLQEALTARQEAQLVVQGILER